MATIIKDLGAVSAYAYAVEKGYTGTEAEFAELMADYADVGQRAEDAAESALNSKTAAQTAAQTATTKASEASTSATSASGSATAASASASAASGSATSAANSATAASGSATAAAGSATTATTKASEASASATAAQTAQTAAEAAQSAAETAQGKAEDAQEAAENAAESVSASAAQIATNTADITQLKEDFTQLDYDLDVLKSLNKGDLTLAQIQQIVQAGRAPEWFSIGEQITVKWSDGTNQYDCPFDIVAFRDVEVQGETGQKPGMILQMHYCTKDGVQFDGNEAFYVVTGSPLVAETYNVTMGVTWGSNVVKDKVYQFTLTQDVPVGGQLVFTTASSTTVALPDTAPANWRVRSYESSSAVNHIEMVTVTEGNSGTSLGTITNTTKYGSSGLNNLQRASYGYNRWSQSAIRQYLNSDDAIGDWWEPQNAYDRRPDQITTLQGFKAGFSSDFLSVLKPVKVVTALNTVSDSEIGTSEVTYDMFFLASLEEEYIVPQLSGVEGAYWPYWKTRLGLDSPQEQGSSGTNANHIR